VCRVLAVTPTSTDPVHLENLSSKVRLRSMCGGLKAMQVVGNVSSMPEIDQTLFVASPSTLIVWWDSGFG